MTDVHGFRNEFAFLSNFFAAPVEIGRWNGKDVEKLVLPTSEHHYQFLKARYHAGQQAIINCATPGQAKREGRRIIMKPDWNVKRTGYMTIVVRAKFDQHPELAEKLMAIDGEIVEENNWNDTFWGVCNGVGENHLGKILMSTREWLQARRNIVNHEKEWAKKD